jgi:hypothetical protein
MLKFNSTTTPVMYMMSLRPMMSWLSGFDEEEAG